MCAGEGGNRDRTHREETLLHSCVNKSRVPLYCLQHGCTHSVSLLLLLTERGVPACMRAVMMAELSPSPSSTAPCSQHKTEEERCHEKRADFCPLSELQASRDNSAGPIP